MAFDVLTLGEIAVKQPLANRIMLKIKNSLDYLYGQTAGIAISGVPNGSFEIYTGVDVSNRIPDAWTRGLYSGGTADIETTSPAHGAQAYKFVHPGGAGNGGGYLESDYMDVSELMSYMLTFIHWATAAGMKNQVQVRYFTKAKVELGAGSPVTLYSSTANPTSAALFSYNFTCPATTRFIKVKIIGGYTDTNVAGTAYFDGLSLERPKQNLTAIATDSTYTVLMTDDIVVWSSGSGGARTWTLPTAVGCLGKKFSFVNRCTSVSKPLTIDGSGSEKVGAATTYVMYNCNSGASAFYFSFLSIISNGTDWEIISVGTDYHPA